MRLPFASAVTVASLGGAVVICALTPWGDPCTAQGFAGHACPIVLSASQTHLRDAVLAAIFLIVGLVAGITTRSAQYLAGGASTLFAVILAGAGDRLTYHVDTPPFISGLPAAEYFLGVIFLASLACLGVLGAVVSRWLPNLLGSSGP